MIFEAPAALAIAEGLGTFAFSDIDRAESILLIGADPSLHQPIIDLRIKKAIRNRAVSLLSITSRDVEMNRHATASLQYPAGSEDSLLRVLTAALKKEQWYETYDADLKAIRLSREAVDLSLATSLTGTQRIVLVDAGLVTPLQPTGNRLEIDVVNLWPNRLIGDAALPPERRRTKTNVTTYKKDSLLLPSGLLGPVTLQTLGR